MITDLIGVTVKENEDGRRTGVVRAVYQDEDDEVIFLVAVTETLTTPPYTSRTLFESWPAEECELR